MTDEWDKRPAVVFNGDAVAEVVSGDEIHHRTPVKYIPREQVERERYAEELEWRIRRIENRLGLAPLIQPADRLGRASSSTPSGSPSSTKTVPSPPSRSPQSPEASNTQPPNEIKSVYGRMDLLHQEFERRKRLGLPYPSWHEIDQMFGRA